MFDGDEKRYELWEVKFLGHMRLQKLYDVITNVPPPRGEDEAAKAMEDSSKNAEAFAELVQCLDDRSLSPIIETPEIMVGKHLKYYVNTICPVESQK